MIQKSTCKSRCLKAATLAVDSWEFPDEVVTLAFSESLHFRENVRYERNFTYMDERNKIRCRVRQENSEMGIRLYTSKFSYSIHQPFNSHHSQ